MIKTCGPGGDPRPLAAYRLGFQSHTYAQWRNFFLRCRVADPDGADLILVAITHLRASQIALAVEIPTNVYQELRDWLKNQHELWTAMYDGPWDAALWSKAAQEPRPTITTLTNLAVRNFSGLKVWHDLGAAIGDYEAQLHVQDVDAPLPALEPLVSLACTLSEQASLSPVLQATVDLAPQLTTLGPRAFLTKVLHAAEMKSAFEEHGAFADILVMGDLLDIWDRTIERALQRVAHLGEPSVIPRTVPQWDRKSGELRLRGVVVRNVAPKAKNLIPILDAFERTGWPQRIDDPLAQPIDPRIPPFHQKLNNQVRLHAAIRELNRGLIELRFHSDGRGEGITWELLPTI